MPSINDFDFELPQELIAQYPKPSRRESRLLEVSGSVLADRCFADLPQLVKKGDLLVFNNTQVIKARLFGHKETGGKVELMIERVVDASHAVAQIRAAKSPKPGSRIVLDSGVELKVEGRCGVENEFFALELLASNEIADWHTLLEKEGRLPLPPYISRLALQEDESRYQTVYAKTPGAVAAPTAGLHFDESLLEDLKSQGIDLAWLTLHVGAGTFQPVRVNDIAEHQMHAECFDISQETVDAVNRTHANGGRVIAVGTTSLRALEAAAQSGKLQPGTGETRIFITPGFRFQVVDCLITNFHLPKSTLLILVSAFAGMESIRSAYQHAIDARYRFFSYGDAMFLEKH